jgi:chaperonin GroEL
MKRSAKVTRNALQNAASIAGHLLTTEAMTADAPTKMASGMGYGGMGVGL